MGIIPFEEFQNFLFYSKKNSYANENSKYELTELNTKKLVLSKGRFRYIDEYAGENPFSGVETVYYDNRPIWQMHYYGWTIDENPERVYKFLRIALRNVDAACSIRGKSNFKMGNFEYTLDINGDLKRFEGREYIYKGDKSVYECVIFGGMLMDLRKK